MVLLTVLIGLIFLYLWLMGWWFAGLLVFLAYWLIGTQAWGHSWIAGLLIGFAPWTFWGVLNGRFDRWAREADAKRLAEKARRDARRTPSPKLLTGPRQ